MKAKAMWSSSRSKALSKGTTLATAPWETSSADTVSPWLAMLHNAYIVCKLKTATLHCLQIENSHTTLSANWKQSHYIVCKLKTVTLHCLQIENSHTKSTQWRKDCGACQQTILTTDSPIPLASEFCVMVRCLFGWKADGSMFRYTLTHLHLQSDLAPSPHFQEMKWLDGLHTAHLNAKSFCLCSVTLDVVLLTTLVGWYMYLFKT